MSLQPPKLMMCWWHNMGAALAEYFWWMADTRYCLASEGFASRTCAAAPNLYRELYLGTRLNIRYAISSRIGHYGTQFQTMLSGNYSQNS